VQKKEIIYINEKRFIAISEITSTLEQDEFEDTNKGVIRIHTSKKNRQHNGQRKSTKEQTTIYKAYI
jgi:hypothetical protein